MGWLDFVDSKPPGLNLRKWTGVYYDYDLRKTFKVSVVAVTRDGAIKELSSRSDGDIKIISLYTTGYAR